MALGSQNRLPNAGDAHPEMFMESENNILPNPNSFIGRVTQHDAARKGAAAFIAGVLVAVVSEALWPQGQ